MSEGTDNAWDALDGGWLYLGRPVAGGFDIATLRPGSALTSANRRTGARQREPLAAAFTSAEAATRFVAEVPLGLELLSIEADDFRAKEEWLRALIEQGASTLVFDPTPGSLPDAASSSTSITVHTALGYILSHRRATACL